jgi:hypothetical protein
MRKKMHVLVSVCASMVGLVLSAEAAKASTVATYDTLGDGNGFTSTLASFGMVNGIDGLRALQFTPAQTVRLTNIDLALGRVLIGQGAGMATVQLCLDANGEPGAVVESWTTSYIQSTNGQIETVTSGRGSTVAAGNKYWITLGRAPGSNLGGGWFMSESDPVGGAVLGSQFVGGEWVVSTYPRPTATRVTGIVEMAGDASEDGRITMDDYALLDRGLARHLGGWRNGDFNGDNLVDSRDYAILDGAYIRQSGVQAAELVAEHEALFGDGYAAEVAAAVPEPGTCAGLLVGLAAVGGRRRRVRL